MDCIFCKIIKGELPSIKVYEDNEVLAFLDINPVNAGHTLVVPKKHYENIHDLPDALFAKIAVVAKKIADAIIKAGAKGVNIGMNNGVHAGQVVFHAHIHVMPRYGKDSHKLWTTTKYATGEASDIGEKIRTLL